MAGKARQTKGGKMINPNDPREKPAMFAHLVPSAPAALPPLKSRTRRSAAAMSVVAMSAAAMSAPERRDGDFSQLSNFSTRGQRGARSELGLGSSTYHPQHRPHDRVMGRGIGYPAWVGSTSHDSSSHASSRSRLGLYHGDESDWNTGGGNASSTSKHSSYGGRSELSNEAKKGCFCCKNK